MTRPSFPRRFWRSLTGRPTGAERCRPVIVTGDDGQPVHTTVLGVQPMSEEGQAVLAEVVRVAQRKHAADLRAARQAADDNVRAVGSLLEAIDPEDERKAREYLRARFANRIDALIERDAKAAG